MDFVDELKLLWLNIANIVYEAGPTGFAFAWSCQNAFRVDDQTGEVFPGPLPVTVISPHLAPHCAARSIKSDSHDSTELAYLASKPLDLDTCSVAIPTIDEQNIKELSRLRELAADTKRRAIQRLKSLPLRYGMKFPN